MEAYAVHFNRQERLTPKDRQFWLAIAALGLGSILTFANLYFVHPLMPDFVERFNITPTVASLSLSVAVIALIVGLLFFGFYSDRYGRTTLMKVTMLLSVIPLFLIPFVESFWLLLVIRTVQGFFMAGLPAAAIAYIGEEIEHKSIGLGITIYIACNAIGGMGGRVLIGVLTDITSMQIAIWTLCGISLLILLIFVFWLPKSRNFEPSQLQIKEDITGMLVHLKDPVLVNAFFMGIALQLAFTGVWTYLPFYLGAEPFSLSMKEISLMYLAYTLGVVGSPIAGKLVQTFSHRTLIISGVVILIAGDLMTLFSSIPMIVIGLCVLCLGFFITHSMAAAYVNMQARHHKGGASSLYLVSYYIGVASGGTATGLLWTSFGWGGIVALTVLLIPISIKIMIDYQKRIKTISRI
ncbi:MFS transporter [Calidifontibacillus oryziterrae]|uniref:MFS transporter n=1 Tax=Calidifontibacillus oryziterrae TaxID=1191699 RepID=UPI0002E21529|nr:MFS transporter [Calidifontibacillus oryziterrae]